MAEFVVEVLLKLSGTAEGVTDIPQDINNGLPQSVVTAVQTALTDLHHAWLQSPHNEYAAIQLLEASLFSFQHTVPMTQSLPAWLWGTATHLTNPAVFLVRVLKQDGSPMRVMAFRGVRSDNHAIVVSPMTPFGHSEALHYIPFHRIAKVDPRDTADRAGHADVEEEVAIHVRNGEIVAVYHTLEEAPRGYLFNDITGQAAAVEVVSWEEMFSRMDAAIQNFKHPPEAEEEGSDGEEETGSEGS